MTPVFLTGVVGIDVTLGSIRDQLATAGDVELYLHSPGGSVYDGISIANLLRAHRRAGYRVRTIVSGLAASMATYIALAGDEILAEDNAVWMIHNPHTLAVGDYRDIQKAGEQLEQLARILARAYADRTRKPLPEIRALMDEETWFYGQEIVEAGWADRLIKAPPTVGAHTREEAIAQARLSVSAMAQVLRQQHNLIADQYQIAACLSAVIHDQAQDQEPFMAEIDPQADPVIVTDDAQEPTPTHLETEQPQSGEDLAPVAAERQRVLDILSLCRSVRMLDLAESLIRSGATLDQAHKAVIDAWVARGGPEIRQTTTAYTPSAYERLRRRIDDYLAAHPELTRAQATQRVLAEAPDLYQAYLEEKFHVA